ncbi:MAG: 50S ribosomal protein L11 methyltransferase [Verrucomicrobia bacterium]|mgnify:CR=1 FL=1|jgi:ribosomal protein L11 methyltransferase|nr:50S ribosomal protein L11 methyltransferase [Verrucomicrobiota bacterium]MBT7701789.1 50S ribosomal protein L11 methyltransferase [Verrucomicrobiota bacterium]
MFVLRIECSRVAAVAVEVALDMVGAAVTRWDEADEDCVRFEEYFCTSDTATARAAQMESVLEQWSGEARCAIGVTELLDRDWQEAWKATIHAARVSERVVVKPSWESWDAQPGDCVIEIDPGMSFGTGLHFTTQSCLRFMDKVLGEALRREGTPPPVDVDRFCDLGCGSGILSIAAVKLGVTAVTAFDIDADAVRIADENCARNGVGEAVSTTASALADTEGLGTFPLVAANILAHVLREEIETITAAVAPGGHLMLAGTTEKDFADVAALYEGRGFTRIDDTGDGEWRSGLFRRRGA